MLVPLLIFFLGALQLYSAWGWRSLEKTNMVTIRTIALLGDRGARVYTGVLGVLLVGLGVWMLVIVLLPTP